MEKTGNEKLLQDKIDQMNLELNHERNKNYDLERRLQVLFFILFYIQHLNQFFFRTRTVPDLSYSLKPEFFKTY